MATVKYRDHHAGATPERRIAARLRNSGSPEADTVTKTGSSARRTFTNIHNSGTAKAHTNPTVGSNRPFRGEGQPTSPLTPGRGRDE
jgi:hypothetical protein